MTISQILSYFNEYGPLRIFVIMFLEALNLTGIPSYLILATIGYLTKQSSFHLLTIFFTTFIGSLCGCLLYYLIALKFGRPMYNYFYYKFPPTQKGLDKAKELSERYGAITCLIGRTIPTVRTFISLMAGVFQVPFQSYLWFSMGGIAIWNSLLLLLGYIFACSL